nr:MAG TPA: hypothetical protein [Crassvirales sp.]
MESFSTPPDCRKSTSRFLILKSIGIKSHYNLNYRSTYSLKKHRTN